MKTSNTVQAAEGSFFRDFVDNSGSVLGDALLTGTGRIDFNTVKFNVRHDLKRIVKELPCGRKEKLLAMAMIQHAISQILSEIAMEEDKMRGL